MHVISDQDEKWNTGETPAVPVSSTWGWLQNRICPHSLFLGWASQTGFFDLLQQHFFMW